MCHPLPHHHHHHHRHRHRRHHRRPFWDRVGVAGASALSVMATKGEGGRPQSIYVFLSTFGQEEDIDGATQAGSTCIPIVTHPHRHIVAPGCTSVSAGLRWLLLQLRFKYVSSCGSGTPPQRGITYRSLGSVFGFRLPRCAVRGLEIFVNEGNLRKILSRISIRLTFSYVAHAVLCGMRRESGFLCVLISIFASRISETKRRKLNAKTAYGISSFSVFCLSTLLYG